jgi:hypothetical protein
VGAVDLLEFSMLGFRPQPGLPKLEFGSRCDNVEKWGLAYNRGSVRNIEGDQHLSIGLEKLRFLNEGKGYRRNALLLAIQG